MSASRCPGQDRRYWNPDDISTVSCPACGYEVELFKDEGRRKCPGCGTVVSNPRVLESCAAWCAFAEDCVGIPAGGSGVTEVSPLLMKIADILLKSVGGGAGDAESEIKKTLTESDVPAAAQEAALDAAGRINVNEYARRSSQSRFSVQ